MNFLFSKNQKNLFYNFVFSLSLLCVTGGQNNINIEKFVYIINYILSLLIFLLKLIINLFS